MKTNPNDTAHPHDTKAIASGYGGQEFDVSGSGLTKREYFAAMAMMGQLADPHSSCDVLRSNGIQPSGNGFVDTAKCAVVLADLLIKELNKE